MTETQNNCVTHGGLLTSDVREELTRILIYRAKPLIMFCELFERYSGTRVSSKPEANSASRISCQ